MVEPFDSAIPLIFGDFFPPFKLSRTLELAIRILNRIPELGDEGGGRKDTVGIPLFLGLFRGERGTEIAGGSGVSCSSIMATSFLNQQQQQIQQQTRLNS